MKNIITVLIFSACIWSCSTSNDSLNINQAPLNFTETITFEVDTLDLDIVSDITENSLYITYSGNNGNNENILKYNLQTLTQSVITHPDFTESRQIEISGNSLFSIGVDQVHKMDLDLGNFITVNSGFHSFFYSRAVKYNDDIILPYGIDNTVTFNTLTNNYTGTIISTPNIRLRSDGEIYNNKLYVFGGSYLSGVQAFNEVNIYDFGINNWTQQTLPFAVYESFTDQYNNNIIVVGNKESDSSNAFIGIYDLATNTFSELTTSLDINNITIRGITVIFDEIYIVYADIISPMPDLVTIKVAKASLL